MNKIEKIIDSIKWENEVPVIEEKDRLKAIKVILALEYEYYNKDSVESITNTLELLLADDEYAMWVGTW